MILHYPSVSYPLRLLVCRSSIGFFIHRPVGNSSPHLFSILSWLKLIDGPLANLERQRRLLSKRQGSLRTELACFVPKPSLLYPSHSYRCHKRPRRQFLRWEPVVPLGQVLRP